MKLKIVVVLILFGAVLVSASIPTLSEFSASSSFSAVITVDKDKIKGSTSNSFQTADSIVTQEAAAQEAPVEEALQISQ